MLIKKTFLIALALNSVLACFCQPVKDWFNNGKEKAKSNDYAGCITVMNMVITAMPNFDSAYYLRGLAKFGLKDYIGSITDFNKAIEINPNDKKDYCYRGMAKTELQDYRGAILDLTKAIDMDSNYFLAYHFRGLSKSSLADYRGAIADFNKVVSGNSSYVPHSYSSMASAKFKLEDFKGTIDAADMAIRLDSTLAGPYQIRGLTKLLMEQKDSGCLDLSKAGELGSPEAYELIKKICN